MIRSRSTAAALFSAAALILTACAPTPPPAPPPPPPPVVTGPEAISERTLLTMAADLAFPPAGYTLTPTGRAKLDEIVPALQILKNAKIVVYGYTDDHPVGRALKAKGIVDNLDLSSKRLVARARAPHEGRTFFWVLNLQRRVEDLLDFFHSRMCSHRLFAKALISNASFSW